jgi:outer membrane biosynthesis protein TonB
MSLPLFISGLLLLQLAGCAMGHEAQSTEAVPEPAAVAIERQPAPASEPATATPRAEEPDPAVAAPAPAVAPPADAEKAPVPVPAAAQAKPAPVTADKPAAKPPAKTAAPAPPQKTVAQVQAVAPMALTTLEQRLKDTNAIGLFTKIALKNQVDDLVKRVRAHHEGSGVTLAQLRQAYDQLLAKVHGLLKDGDPALAGSIMASREAIWQVLTDPVKFAKL